MFPKFRDEPRSRRLKHIDMEFPRGLRSERQAHQLDGRWHILEGSTRANTVGNMMRGRQPWVAQPWFRISGPEMAFKVEPITNATVIVPRALYDHPYFIAIFTT
jgi:hypothetical protein